MERSAKRPQGDQARSVEWDAKRRRTGGNDGTAGGASSTHTSTEGQEVPASSGYDYEVFLSFREPDTRAAFTDFLYTSLDAAGIRTFKDGEELHIGEVLAPELLQAINQSKISVPIFSKGYASSVWCLKELVQMVECWKNGRQKIMPIFYDVAPLEVRHQVGGYAEAFRSHEEKQRYDKDTILEWKTALSAVGAINGWDLHNKTNRQEGNFAKEVTEEVFRELKRAYLVVSDCLVNVDNHVDAVMEMICSRTNETQIVGIHGMGGIGKTTIAKIIYNQLSSNFKDRCFLSNIRETSKHKGIECLHNQLMSDILRMKRIAINNIDEGTQTIKDRLSKKRVLLLLDDVEKENHIDALVGKRDWFGRGSKIIITTRNKEILRFPRVDHSYELKCMDPDQSLQLFSKHAFRRNSPLDEYRYQSNRAICIAGGLPLALEVIGSLLSRVAKGKWDGKLVELENVQPKHVQCKLEISYNALGVLEQHMFLDIACLFIGYKKDVLIYFWDKSILSVEEAINVLENMSLIKINDNNEVWMHDQLRDLGREIVRRKSYMKIEKQSRVWDPKEGSYFMRRPKGDKEVEALRIAFDDQRQHCFTYEGFKSLWNLRFLEVNCRDRFFHAEERLLWRKSSSTLIPENSDLLPQLRWLSWHDIPPTFNITNFSMESVVILDLSGSQIMDDWNGWSHMKVMENLKVLNLTSCHCLERTPIFSAHSNLECLILRGCRSLIAIDRSICQLKHLVFLDLSYCENLQRLPDELGRYLARLEYLSLKLCRSLERLPDSIGYLESLIDLNISGARIEEIPDSIGNLNNLKVVKMGEIGIRKIPDAFWTIEKLEEIVGEYTPHHRVHVKIGTCIYKNQSLRILKLTHADIYALPRLPESLIELRLSELYMDMFPDLSNLTRLKELDLVFGRPDSDVKSYGPVEYPIPRWMGNLSKLESLKLDSDYVTTSPTELSLLPHLNELRLVCPVLRCLPRLPSSLSSLCLQRCSSLCSIEGLLNLKKLSSLEISSAAIMDIEGLGCLENLQDLRLWNLQQVERLLDLSNLKKLRRLQVENCGDLVEIRGELPQSLQELLISYCESLQKLPDLSSLKELQQVDIASCTKLKVEAILGSTRRSHANLWENLQYLRICGLGQVEILPNLSNLKNLRRLQVENCGDLVEIQGELSQSLEELNISSCESLQKLPGLSSLKGLRRVKIYCCGKLNVEAISRLCSEMSVEFVG